MLVLWSVLGHSREALNVVSFPHEVENNQTEGEEEGHGAWCLEDCVRMWETRQRPGLDAGHTSSWSLDKFSVSYSI